MKVGTISLQEYNLQMRRLRENPCLKYVLPTMDYYFQLNSKTSIVNSLKHQSSTQRIAYAEVNITFYGNVYMKFLEQRPTNGVSKTIRMVSPMLLGLR